MKSKMYKQKKIVIKFLSLFSLAFIISATIYAVQAYSFSIGLFNDFDIQISGNNYIDTAYIEDEMLIEITFNCHKGFPKKIQEDRRIASQGRKANQPLRNRSAGSIFKNPSDQLAAGYLIDQAGLKGTQRGGACISKKHANFIINLGEATADDVFYLISLAKEKVSEVFDINLELEIKLVGFPKSMMNEIQNV